MYGATRARAILFGLVVVSSSSRLVRAEPAEHADPASSPRFHLSYETTIDSCPNAPAFLAAIRARTDRPRLAAPGERALTFAVRITGDPSGQVIGGLEIREPDGTRQKRTVESQTCADVAKALALVVALYLDPDAESSAEPAPPLPAPAPTPRARAVEPKGRAPSGPPARPVRIGAGGAAGVLGGIGPAIAPVVGAFADVKIAGAAWPSWFRPSVRLSIDAATTGADVGVGSQRYYLIAGALRVCPVDVSLVRTLRVGPCVGMQAGLHRGTSEGIPNARAQDKAWLAPTATASFSLDLSDAVTLELEGGIVAPLQRTRFFLAPDLTLFHTPAVSGTASAAVLIRFR